MKPNDWEWFGADDGRDDDWSYGGDSAIPSLGGPAGENFASFVANGSGGFSGWVRTPGDLAPKAAPARHKLRVLSGSLSTGDNPAPPSSIEAFFDLIDLGLGMTSTSGSTPGTFSFGDVFPAGASITLDGRGLEPGTPVEVTFDGAPTGGPAITTTAAGAIPADARVTVPAGTAPGEHVIVITIGDEVSTFHIRVPAPPSATVATPAVAPGGTATVQLRDWRTIRGTGQTVAVRIGGEVQACVATDAAGNADAQVPVPAGQPVGPASFDLLAGTKCIPGGEQSDLPARVLNAPFTVAAPPADPPVVPPAPPAGPPAPPAGPPTKPSPPTVRVPTIRSARLVNGRRAVQLTLNPGTAKRVRITARTAGLVRLTDRAKPRLVTMTVPRTVNRVPGRAGGVQVVLTPAGRRALARTRTLRVLVVVQPVGAKGRETRRIITFRTR